MDETAAFDGARKFASFEAWHYWYYTCQDCHQSTEHEVIHNCVKRSKQLTLPGI